MRFVTDPAVTLAWLPLLNADEKGQAAVQVPKTSNGRIRVRADAHAAGYLGSADVTFDLPALQTTQ